MGAKRFKEIEADKSSYQVLFDGGYYNDDANYFAGLNEAVGYLVYARLLKNNSVNVTAFGNVVKLGQFSEQIDERTLIRAANEAEKIGVEYLNQCLDYLHRETGNERRVSKLKFKSIGR